ncbi:hypothetical protein [Streptomyces sp. TBY4]|uniref:hypothetical protein n=1 Tax=Streptomyces sp. TBY4 TaxID=2962030 RepID=UPI0020B71198|nr:hypothetical protein [Streptomyces sp. TBY4]MCP3759557.1 hypothetical protein [Streptomyces sp. TBY4]
MRIRRAVAAFAVAGVVVACGPASGGGGAPAVPSSPAPATTGATSAPATPPPPTSAAPAPAPSPTPTKAPPQTRTPAPADAKPAPTPSRSAAKPPVASRTPQEPPSGACEIVSNAGNCYNAGQFCRKADLGRSTHAANRRIIYCRMDGTQPRWQY